MIFTFIFHAQKIHLAKVQGASLLHPSTLVDHLRRNLMQLAHSGRFLPAAALILHVVSRQQNPAICAHVPTHAKNCSTPGARRRTCSIIHRPGRRKCVVFIDLAKYIKVPHVGMQICLLYRIRIVHQGCEKHLSVVVICWILLETSHRWSTGRLESAVSKPIIACISATIVLQSTQSPDSHVCSRQAASTASGTVEPETKMTSCLPLLVEK